MEQSRKCEYCGWDNVRGQLYEATLPSGKVIQVGPYCALKLQGAQPKKKVSIHAN